MSKRKSYMFLGLTILLTIIATTRSESNITDTDAQIFDSNSSHAGLLDENTYTKAIEDFQKFAGLNDTGELDEETKKRMSVSSYAVPDKVVHTGKRSKRSKGMCSYWTRRDLTYKIINYPHNLTATDVDAEIARAFALWSEHIDINFTPKKTGNVDIEIKFGSRDHGDQFPFDGPNGTVAHTFDPNPCAMHFDDDEQWTINSDSGINLLQVVAHEIGHVLGLFHSGNPSAIMREAYLGYIPNATLDKEDILAIQQFYGKRCTICPTSTTPKGLHKDIKIDTIFRSAEGQIYVFMGENYYELSEELKALGNPKLISERWPGLPGNIDAAFTYTWRTYFFKGTQIWRYNGAQLYDGFPKKINEVVEGIPDHFDAAMAWGDIFTIYVFKGSKFWRYDPRKIPPTVTGSTKDINNWQGVPTDLDAAIQHTDGYTYFFKGDKYYKIFDKRPFSPEPCDTAILLFGC